MGRISVRTTRLWIPTLGCAVAAGIGIGLDAQSQGGAVDTARRYVERNKQALRLTGSDTNDMVVSSAVRDDHNGVTHVYFEQRYRGIPVYNGILNVSVLANGSVLTAGSRFVSNIASAAGGQQPEEGGRRGRPACRRARQPPAHRTVPGRGKPGRSSEATDPVGGGHR